MSNSNQSRIDCLLSNRNLLRCLCEVCLRISTHRAEIVRLKQKNDRSGEEEMLLRENEWFLTKNEKLIDMLVSFQNRNNASRDLLGINSVLTLASLISQTDMSRVNDFSEKFSDLSIRQFQKVKELSCANSDVFIKFEKDYVTRRAIPQIRRGVKENHLLHDRSEVILRALKEYEAHRYLCACSLLAVQVEGLFGDLLEEMGVTREKIESQAIGNKVLALNNKSEDFVWYEYYAFEFPVLRNRIAHGNIRNQELSLQNAISLILDFAQICEYACNSTSIPINKKISILKAFRKGNKNERYQALLDFVPVLEVAIPSFYGLQECERNLRKSYEQKSFVAYVRKCITEYDKDGLDGLIKLLSKIGNEILKNDSLDALKDDVISEKKAREIKSKKILNEFRVEFKS